MHSRLFKKTGLFLTLIAALFLFVGCGGGEGGETSDNTLLNDNKPPVAFDQNITIEDSPKVSVNEDGNVSIGLRAVDEDGDPLTYTILTPPAHGQLTGIAPALTYTPEADYAGEDQFTFRANDGTVDSQIATVRIRILSVNDVPIAHEQNLTTPEDTPLNLFLTSRDDDSDPLIYTIIAVPSHGTLSGTPPDLSYTPEANYVGSDHFTFKVNDGTVDSSAATVTIMITPVNDAPVAYDDHGSMDEDTGISMAVLDNDRDFDGSLDVTSVMIATLPTHGTATIIDGNISYTPKLNYHGTDSLSYTVRDDAGLRSNEANVSLRIVSVNDAPIAVDDNASTEEDTAIEMDILSNDRDSDGVLDVTSLHISTLPSHGTATVTNGHVSYTPESNYHGLDSLSYTVRDNEGSLSDEADVTITVSSINDAPIANEQNLSTPEDSNLSIQLTGSDIDGDVLAYSITVQPSHGALSGTAPDLIYTPAEDYVGEDHFSFMVNDGTVDSVEAAIDIQVTPVNDAPVAYMQSLITREDTNLSIILTGNDHDGDSLSYHIKTLPIHGVIHGTVPNLIYTPEINYAGSDSFTFIVNDSIETSLEAMISIQIIPVNDAPVANAGEDKIIIRGDKVQFDASLSYDIDGVITNYIWYEGNTTLSTKKIFDKIMLTEGVHQIILKVTDDKNATNSDVKNITVNPCCDGCNYPDPTQTNPFH